MNFLKKKTSWSNAELIVLKLCIATAYILVGACFHSFFHRYYAPVVVVFAVTVFWSMYLWISKLKAGTSKPPDIE